MQPDAWLGREVDVVVELPRFGLVKRDTTGAVDLRSPVPVPWNYGRAEGHVGGDGDPLDVILLGARRPVGPAGRHRVVGVVAFVDAGLPDHKLVCGQPGPATRAVVATFFAVYTAVKRARYRWRGVEGWTGVRGVVWGEPS